MTTTLLATISLQLLCQLIVSGVPGLNDTNFATNRSPLPDGYVVPAGASVAHLSSLSLERICQLLATNNFGVTENGTLVEGGGETTNQTPNVTLPTGYVRFPEVHAAYKVYQEYITWDAARDVCISDGAHLAIPDSSDKIQRIVSLRVGNAIDEWLSVGLYYSNTTNKWVRVDNGVPVTSIEWASFDPSPTEGCALLPISENKLMSLPCRFLRHYYVCEIAI